MTMLVNKFQRILGLKIHEKYRNEITIKNRPIDFVTHMGHHSNQTTWLETIAEAVKGYKYNAASNEFRHKKDVYAKNNK